MKTVIANDAAGRPLRVGDAVLIERRSAESLERHGDRVPDGPVTGTVAGWITGRHVYLAVDVADIGVRHFSPENLTRTAPDER